MVASTQKVTRWLLTGPLQPWQQQVSEENTNTECWAGGPADRTKSGRRQTTTYVVCSGCLQLWRLSSCVFYQSSYKAEAAFIATSAECVIGLLISATNSLFQWTVGKLRWETALGLGLPLYDFGIIKSEGREPSRAS